MTRQFKYFLITIAFVLSGTLCAAEYTGPICDFTPQSRCIEQCQGSYTKRWSNCFGSLTYPSGSEYVGEFKDGERHGQGTLTFANGMKYVGEWKDGMYNGQGTYTSENGEKLVGDFKDGKRIGRGIYYSANGSIKESGIYKDDKLVTSQYIDPNSFTRIARNSTAPAVSDSQRQNAEQSNTQSNLPACQNSGRSTWSNCFGSWTYVNGNKYVGEFKDGERHGQGTLYHLTDDQFKGNKYVGEFKDSKYNGQGILTTVDGKRYEGIFEENKFIREAKVNLPSLNTNTANNAERNDLELERQRLAEQKRRFDSEKEQREQEKKASRIAIKGSASQPDANGDFTITIQTGADTASLKIDGEELGGNRDGNYVIKRVARVGEQNSYAITARDVFGNTDSATITVARQVADSRPAIPRLNPASVKVQLPRDAVAIIIGIENYRRVAKADFANADAKDFYSYASRALGIKPENIKLLVDDGADDIEMLNAFQNWLPLKVNKGKTDVYVFYSGHGYPSQDGSSLYFLPFNVDKQYLDRTSVKQKEVVAALQKVQAKSVTMFIDACYSGQTRGGEVLIAGLKPIALKADEKAYPSDFTVITASAADQFSSASQDLKHGIFSFYLMKGLEGDADLNKDGKITSGELQQYLSEMVGRQAMGLNRTQNTQLFGDAARVLVGR